MLIVLLAAIGKIPAAAVDPVHSVKKTAGFCVKVNGKLTACSVSSPAGHNMLAVMPQHIFSPFGNTIEPLSVPNDDVAPLMMLCAMPFSALLSD